MFAACTVRLSEHVAVAVCHRIRGPGMMRFRNLRSSKVGGSDKSKYGAWFVFGGYPPR